MISGYYCVLRDVARSTDKRHYVLARCRHCGILFLTSPSNRGRHDLLCPFGCRQLCKRKQSNKRSQAYYQTPEGQFKKKVVNQRRYTTSKPPDKPQEHHVTENASFQKHVQFLVCLIEDKKMSLDQIRCFLRDLMKKWRQHPLFIWSETGKVPDG